MSALNYSMKLEAAFGIFGDDKKFPADSFRIRPTEAIEEGLNWIMCKGIISEENYSIMCQEFNFGDLSLEKIISDEIEKEKIDDLLRQLKNLRKER